MFELFLYAIRIVWEYIYFVSKLFDPANPSELDVLFISGSASLMNDGCINFSVDLAVVCGVENYKGCNLGGLFINFVSQPVIAHRPIKPIKINIRAGRWIGVGVTLKNRSLLISMISIIRYKVFGHH